MGEIFKAYASLFVMLIFLTGGTGLISASIDAKRADDFMTAIITEISDTNFASGVVNACKDKALDAGYVLNVDMVDADGDMHTDSAVCSLIYHYTISIFDINNEHTIRAVVR